MANPQAPLIRGNTVLAALLLAAALPRLFAAPCRVCGDGVTVSFRDDVRVTATPGDSLGPAIAAGGPPGDERIFIVWLDTYHEPGATDPQGDVELWLQPADRGGCSLGAPGPGAPQPRRLTFNDTDEQSPAVAYDAAASAVLIVFERGGDVYVLRSTDNGASFEPEARLNQGSAGACRAPAVAAARTPDGALHAHAAWEADVAGSPHVFYRRNLNGGAPADWGGASGPQEDDIGAAHFPGTRTWAPSIAADGFGAGASATGVSLVCLGNRDDARGGVYFLRSLDSGSAFSGQVTAPGSAPLRIDTFAAHTPDHALIVSAPASPGGYLWELAAWSAVRQNPPTTQAPYVDAQAEDGAGPAVRSAWNNGGASNDVEARRGIGPAEPVAGAVLADASMAPPGGDNTALLFWVETSSGSSEVWAERYVLDPAARPNIGRGCGAFQLTGVSPGRSDPATGARGPGAAGAGGDVFVVWSDNRDGNVEVYFKRSDHEVAPPANVAAAVAACPQTAFADLTWDSSGCDAARYLVSYGTSPGTPLLTLDAGLTEPYRLGGLNQSTTYYITVTAEDGACNSEASQEIEITTPACFAPDLVLAGTALQDACAYGGAGGDLRPDPGERITLTVSLTNRGTADATGVGAVLTSLTAGATVIAGDSTFGTIGSGATVSGPAFTVDLSRTLGCGSRAILLLEAAAPEGSFSQHVVIDIPTPCTPCFSPACNTGADASATDTTPVCRGTAIALDGSASAPAGCGGSVLYDWYCGPTYIGAGIAQSVTPAGSVTCTLVAACSTDLACRSSSDVALTIYQLPQITIVEDPPPYHCEGDTVTLTASTPDPGAAYSWDTGANQPSITVSAPGTYTITVVDTHPCANSRPVRVEFFQHPPADAGPDVSLCPGETATLGTPPFAGLGYLWTPPDYLDDPFTARPTAFPPVTTSYLLTVTDLVTGCDSQDDATVTVPPLPARIARLFALRSGADVALSWDEDPSSSGGYHAYRVVSGPEIPLANASNPQAFRVCGTDAPSLVSCTHAGAVPGPPANPGLLFYQIVGVCGADAAEGPN